MVRLGFKVVRDLVMQAALSMRVFRSGTYTDAMEQLRQHSVATAVVARQLSRHTPWESDYAFLCGIMHDVGMAASILVLSEGTGERRPKLLSVWPGIDRIHEKASGILTQLWKLPPEVQMVVGNHHHPRLDGRVHPMIATVVVADEIAKELGYDVSSTPDERSDDGMDGLSGAILNVDSNPQAVIDEARDALGLSEQIIEMVRLESDELLSQDCN